MAVCILALSACNTTKSTSTSDYAVNAPSDGGYNPYPSDPGGRAHTDSLLPSPAYGQRVPPPPSGYTPPPVPSSSSSRKSTTVASSSSTKKPTTSSNKSTASTSKATPPKKSTASTSGGSSKSSTTTKASGTAKKSSGGVHTVVQGDTLWAIARKNGTSVEKIKSLNGLSSDKLKLGTKLKLP